MCGICGCDHHHEHTSTENHQWITVEQDLLAANNHIAEHNKDFFKQQQITAINLVSSPGSGKTTLLEKTISAMKNHFPISVIEGDQQTDLDSKRLQALGIDAFQINTGKVCHLNADMVHHALHNLSPKRNSLLFIENVGNLVCPALFNLGEHFRVVMMSVTEGDDKPLKYPGIFESADLLLINKTDLLPYVDFDMEKCYRYAKEINPRLTLLQISAKNNDISSWQQWLSSTTMTHA